MSGNDKKKNCVLLMLCTAKSCIRLSRLCASCESCQIVVFCVSQQASTQATEMLQLFLKKVDIVVGVCLEGQVLVQMMVVQEECCPSILKLGIRVAVFDQRRAQGADWLGELHPAVLERTLRTT